MITPVKTYFATSIRKLASFSCRWFTPCCGFFSESAPAASCCLLGWGFWGFALSLLVVIFFPRYARTLFFLFSLVPLQGVALELCSLDTSRTLQGLLFLTEGVALELCSLDPSRTSVGIMRESRSSFARLTLHELEFSAGSRGWRLRRLTFGFRFRRLTVLYPPTSLFLPLINYSLVHFRVLDSDLTMRVMMKRGGIIQP